MPPAPDGNAPGGGAPLSSPPPNWPGGMPPMGRPQMPQEFFGGRTQNFQMPLNFIGNSGPGLPGPPMTGDALQPLANKAPNMAASAQWAIDNPTPPPQAAAAPQTGFGSFSDIGGMGQSWASPFSKG
jgi:hypothetical protein